MTQPASTRRAGPYLGNDSATSFPFSFKVFSTSDIELTRTDADGITYILTLDVDYSITLNVDQESDPGGTITYPLSGDPLASGDSLVGVGALPYDQTFSFPPGGQYRAQSHETAFDRTVAQIQQLAEELGRSLTLPVSAGGVNTELPAPEANKVLGWSDGADALVNLDPSILATVVAYGTARVDTFAADGAQTTFTLSESPAVGANLVVLVGGVDQTQGTDYNWTGGTSLVFTEAPPLGVTVKARYMRALAQADMVLPPQAGNSGKFLTTNGADLAWSTVAGGGATAFGINVFDYLSTAQKNDVQAGTLTLDVSPAVQDAIDDAIAVGGMVLFPRGQYRLDSSLVLDYSAVTLDPTQGTTNRITLRGEGAGATQLTASHGAALIDHRGGVGGSAGVHSFFYLEGLSLYNTTPRQAGSIAVKMDNTSLWAFKDISILGFEYGVKGTDVLSGHWTGGRLWSCTYGFRFEYVDFSRPNAISFRSVAVAGNRRYGGYVLGGALFSMYGGSVEGNGIDANGTADGDAMRSNCWGLKFEDSGVEGVVGATIHGGYFEGNSGKADVWISQLANGATHSFTGCSFLRFSATQYTLNNILFDNNPTTINCRVSVQGCGFRSQSPYTASSSRYYIGSQVAKMYDGAGNYYDSETEIDRAVFAPLPLPRIPTANYPTTVGPYTGGLFWHPTLKRLMVGGDTKFQFASDGAYEVYSTDNAPTLIYMTNQPVFVWASSMAANRNLTLSVANAYVGARWLIIRKTGGVYSLSIYSAGTGLLTSTLYNDGDWAEFQFDGSSWILLRAGASASSGDTPAKSAVRATRTVAQDISQNVDTTIVWDTEDFDTLGEYNPGTGVFTAKHTGKYRVTATASTKQFAWVAGTQFFLRLLVNGSVVAVGTRDFKNASGSAQASSVLSTTVNLTVGSTIAVTGRTDRTADADANEISASGISNHLSIERIT